MLMEFLGHYSLFLAKSVTVVVAILLVIGFSIAMANKEDDDRPKLKIKKVNKRFQRYSEIMHHKILSRKELKQFKKAQKKIQDARKKDTLRRIFFVDFQGDIKASETYCLTEEINAILTTATSDDEVLVRIDSSGGMVHAYGLAASQLKRLREHNIPLTVAIDKIAASGGYMMACVADRIIAAPFAIVGSIGVIAQLPNFHRYLKKHNIEFEQIMAGEYKRTLSLFGENTRKDRQKMQEDIDNIHLLFKNFITEHRPEIDIDNVSTGEHWHGIEALTLKLVDQVMTCDEYLMTAAHHADIYQVRYKIKRKVTQKIVAGIDACFNTLYTWLNRSTTQ